MASDKTVVVARIWDLLQIEGQGRTVVYFEDVKEAIDYCNSLDNKKRSTSNPANFMKDLIRTDSASGNWPQRLCDLRIGGRQRVGLNRVFEFVPFAPGQTEPFPNRYLPNSSMTPVSLQSVSLPLASKALGRKDESWLVQVAVSLRILEQHFALNSSLAVREVVHLQTGVKLANSEIDGLFRAIVEKNGNRSHILVTCEAKQKGERILEHQIVEQVVAAYKSIKLSSHEEDLDIGQIVPVALKAVGEKGEIYVVEFEPWTPSDAEAPEALLKELKLAAETLFRLVPPVPGIGFQPKNRKKRR